MTRGQRVIFIVLGLAFFGLAVAALLRGFPWFIAILWAASGVIMLLLYRRSAPRPVRPRPEPVDPSTRARRSGNPAVRAAQEQQDQRPPGAGA